MENLIIHRLLCCHTFYYVSQFRGNKKVIRDKFNAGVLKSRSSWITKFLKYATLGNSVIKITNSKLASFSFSLCNFSQTFSTLLKNSIKIKTFFVFRYRAASNLLLTIGFFLSSKNEFTFNFKLFDFARITISVQIVCSISSAPL